MEEEHDCEICEKKETCHRRGLNDWVEDNGEMLEQLRETFEPWLNDTYKIACMKNPMVGMLGDLFRLAMTASAVYGYWYATEKEKGTKLPDFLKDME